jgi:two-component system response regulator DevR
VKKIRLMIVDDHEVVRLGMRAAFELESDITVVGEASNGAEALAKINVLMPEVVLMDVRMEKMGGIEACREIRSQFPQIFVLMITSYPDDEAVTASVLAGASGYLLKNVSRTELLKAVHLVANGASLLKPEAAKKAISQMTILTNRSTTRSSDELTEREREVLGLVARGYTNKQIAEALYLSEKTARNHVSHILEKLGLSRRSEAAVYAVEHKMLQPRQPS